MKKETEEKSKGGSRGVFIVLLFLVGGVLGGIAWLNGEVQAAQERLDGAKEDYEKMKVWQRSIAKIRANQKKGGTKSGVKPPDNPSGILSYLAEKARQSGIPAQLTRTEAPEKRPAGKGWTEYAWKIRITGNKKNLLKRESIVNFLQAVETERPYLKTKDLTIDYQESDFLKAYIVISYLVKDK